MYPVALRLGSFEISSFGVLVGLGAVLGLVLLRREMARSGLEARRGQEAAIVALLGGMAGAKLLFVLEHAQEPLRETLLARGGLSWFGGLLGGLVAGILAVHRERLPLLATLSAAAPAVALGQAIGRVGCFLVGDDYGKPSSLPWAVAFPRGLPPTDVPVHPTQLYETAGLLLVTALLLRWRHRAVADRTIVARYLLMAGALRFGIEFVRVNPRVVDGLSLAHLISAAAVLVGLALVATGRRRPAATAP